MAHRSTRCCTRTSLAGASFKAVLQKLPAHRFTGQGNLPSTQRILPSLLIENAGQGNSAINPEKSAITTGRKRWPRKICHQPMKSCQRSQSNSAIGPENSAITTLGTLTNGFLPSARRILPSPSLENAGQRKSAINPENSAISISGTTDPVHH